MIAIREGKKHGAMIETLMIAENTYGLKGLMTMLFSPLVVIADIAVALSSFSKQMIPFISPRMMTTSDFCCSSNSATDSQHHKHVILISEMSRLSCQLTDTTKSISQLE